MNLEPQVLIEELSNVFVCVQCSLDMCSMSNVFAPGHSAVVGHNPELSETRLNVWLQKGRCSSGFTEPAV